MKTLAQDQDISQELLNLARLTPQRRDLVAFVGRNQGLLLDNVKYAFLEAAGGKYAFTPIFITTQPSEATELASHDLPVHLFPGQDLKFAAQASVVVCDNFNWRLTPLWPLLHRAKVFQLWHGIPLKKIGKAEIESPVNMTPEKAAYLTAMYSNFHSVLSTSPTVTEILSQVFYEPRRAFIEAGYPRNDPLLRPPTALDFINADTQLFSEIKAHKRRGGKVLLHMPTFRDSGIGPLAAQGLHPERMAAFALEHNLLWILKLHPTLSLEKQTFPGLTICKSTGDVYPILRETDILLTDYSSVYFDFLLCDRPIHFHVADLEDYTRHNREFMLEFSAWTPGPVSQVEDELYAQLQQTLRGEDRFAEERRRIRDQLHTHQDSGSAARVCRHIESMLESS